MSIRSLACIFGLVIVTLSPISSAQVPDEFRTNLLVLTIRDCTGVAPNDSCTRPDPSQDLNPAVAVDFRDAIGGSVSSTISVPGLGSVFGEIILGGMLDTPTLKADVITTATSRNAASLSGQQTFTYTGTMATQLTFGGEFTYTATGAVLPSCSGIKETVFGPRLFTFDQCGGVSVGLEVRNVATNELISPPGLALLSRQAFVPSPSTLAATVDVVPGETYVVTAFGQFVARGAGQRIDATNSFKIGLVDPDTGAVTQDIPPSLPGLADTLIPATDPNPTAVLTPIDIGPGSNEIELDDEIEVAILATADLSPGDVDLASVRFGPDAVTGEDFDIEDVNNDGLLDLVVEFDGDDTGISCNDTSAYLSARTLSGERLIGEDGITSEDCDDDDNDDSDDND